MGIEMLALLPLVIPACLICGIDSRPVWWFAATVIGGVVSATVCAMAWSLLSPRAADEDTLSRVPLEAERIDEVTP